LLRETDALDEAEDVLGAVQREAPDNTSALNALGWVFARRRRLDAATDCFQKLSALQPANIGALHALGLIARERGDHEASLDSSEVPGRFDDGAACAARDRQHLSEPEAFDDVTRKFTGILRTWPNEPHMLRRRSIAPALLKRSPATPRDRRARGQIRRAQWSAPMLAGCSAESFWKQSVAASSRFALREHPAESVQGAGIVGRLALHRAEHILRFIQRVGIGPQQMAELYPRDEIGWLQRE